MPELKCYIAKQKEHHRKQTFQEELIQFLERVESNKMSGISGIRCDPYRVKFAFCRVPGARCACPRLFNVTLSA
jgi:hypothetical protein